MDRHRARHRYRTVSLAIVAVSTILLASCGWFGSEAEPLVDVPGGDPMLGRQAIQDFSCFACHSIPGINNANAAVGPPLDAWVDRRFIAGELPNEPDNLIAFIVNPQRFRPGTAMPITGISEEEARHVAAYLYTLDD